MLGEPEPWTILWRDRERACVALHAYPPTLIGARALASDAAAVARPRIARRITARAGRAHLAGADVTDAVRIARRLAERGFGATVGYWNADSDAPADVADACLRALEALAHEQFDAHLAVKPTALRFSSALFDRIVSRGGELGVPVQLDSMGPEAARPTWDLLDAFARPGLGCTLPGRWRRSLADADRAVALGLRVRVVKGQWPDPTDPKRDPRAAVLGVVDRLAGRAVHVAIATHDRGLAARALDRLRGAGTPHELELMLGLPRRRMPETRTRVYVPFGHPSLPYAPNAALREPRVAFWLSHDLVRGGR